MNPEFKDTVKHVRQEMTTSEARLYTALDALREGVVIATENGEIIYCNPSLCSIYGVRNPEEGERLILEDLQNDFQLWTPDGGHMLPVDAWPISRVARGERVQDVELRLCRPDQGWERIVSFSGAILETAAGERLVYLALHDLTEQRRTAASLRESEERFRVVQELSPDGFTILRPVRDTQGQIRDFIWVYENAAMGRMNGTDPQEVVGKHVLEVIPDYDRTPFHRLYRDVAETGKAAVLEAPFYRGAEKRWLRVAVVPSDDNIVVLTQDINERKQAEERLRLSEEKFAKAFAHNSAAIVLSRLDDGRYLDVNETWLAMVGFQREEIIGKTPNELKIWPARDRDRAIQVLRDQGSVHNLEFTLTKQNGESTEVLASADVLTLAGDKVLLWSIVDITDRKRAEEALKKREEQLRKAKDELEIRVEERTRELVQAHATLQKETEERLAALESLRENEQLLIQQSRLAAMGEMLSNIAHQWRQPLNSLGLILQTLPLDLELGQLNVETLNNAVSQAMQLVQHMSHTIDDFRDYLQPERDKKCFCVNEVIATTESLLKATLQSMEVELQIKETEQIFVEGFRNEFSQVLINLLTNAREAFSERGISFPKLVVELRKEQDKCVITVADNAGGIAEELLDKIFDPYFTTKGPKGTGIGLFMSRSIIQGSMNGSLTVRNTAEGAEFRIELPSCRPNSRG